MGRKSTKSVSSESSRAHLWCMTARCADHDQFVVGPGAAEAKAAGSSSRMAACPSIVGFSVIRHGLLDLSEQVPVGFWDSL